MCRLTLGVWLAALFGFLPGFLFSQVITEFTVPTSGSGPAGIAAGPDGALWFTEGDGNKIGRITTAGVFTEFTIPTSGSAPVGIAAGPDGALWFTEGFSNGIDKIGRVTTAGVITNEFTIPTSGSAPFVIASGPDGALWFTEAAGNKIGRITTAGVITEFTAPTSGSGPFGIAAGPDGALWFTELGSGAAGNKIGRITTAGVITEFTTPTSGSEPFGIASGSDGALWFTEAAGNKIGRITTPATPCSTDATTFCAGSPGRFKVQVKYTTPNSTVGGPEGALTTQASGDGQAVLLTSDTGYFWFFSASNVEMVIKVVDGRAVNGRFWVFAAGLTNVNVVITVTDTQTAAVKTYTNTQGTAFQPIQDTNAFASIPEEAVGAPAGDAAAESAGISADLARILSGSRVRSLTAAAFQAACAPNATTLCLNGGRFMVQTLWSTPQGQSGSGQAIPLTSDTGYFWFFSANNVEMVVKVLNACGFNSRFWTFAGGLTNVNVVMTVTDTQTGAIKTYTNSQGTPFQPIQDTSAFATCP